MIIYKVTNKINNKNYIGITSNPIDVRKRQHKYNSKNPKYIFHKAILKYGWENFIWEILEEGEFNLDDALSKEAKNIEKYNSH